MKSAAEYINSGILETYVLGLTSDEENLKISAMAEMHAEIRTEIEDITNSLLSYAEKNAPPVNPTIKPMVMAIIDYTERLTKGEVPTSPPILHENSSIVDYATWLNRQDMIIPVNFNDIHAKLIGSNAEAMTAILWLKGSTPYEIHDKEHEKFLIIEGTCDIVTDDNVYPLVPGDYFSIPLHVGHVVKVTSSIPCKAILQRVAA
jgi:mannose-6-phosphate isomerase-like protein (cupin superfamily)